MLNFTPCPITCMISFERNGDWVILFSGSHVADEIRFLAFNIVIIDFSLADLMVMGIHISEIKT